MIGAGSTFGLLGHELRLTWRGWFGRRSDGRVRNLPQLVITAAFLVFVLLWPGRALAELLPRLQAVTPPIAVIIDAIVAGLFTLMLSQTLLASVKAFYTRGDLDLLLSAPIAPTKVLGVRAVSMAISAATIFAVILTPLLIPTIIAEPRWLSAYVVLAAVSMAATGLGLVIALGLLTTIGPRRTRTVAQLLAAVIGASFFILSQLQNLIGNHRAGGFWMRLFGDVWSGERSLPVVALWPARAVLGEPGPVLALLAVGGSVFLGAIVLVGRRFADDAAAAKGAEAAARARLPARDAHFRSGAFSALLAKETRLLWRDPAMLSQVLLRALYIPPLVFVLVRSAGGAADPITAGAAAGLVFMAGQVSASLSWITISAEEAPELLAMAPAKPGMIWRAKLAAGLIPLALFFAIPLAILALRSPSTAGIAAVGCALAAVSAGWINIWLQTPGDRKDFRRRRGAGLAATIAELLEAFLWGAAVYLAVIGQWPLAAGAVALAILLLLVARRPEEAILRRLTEVST